MLSNSIIIRWLGVQDYLTSWEAMRKFTDSRDENTPDEVWLLEHSPVYTQGQNGQAKHILNPGSIPIIQTDRGGQVTYHGPGQLMIYTLIDLKRKKLDTREFVTLLEQTLIDFLEWQAILAYAKRDAPGVYINDKKIGSIGLRVRRGCAYHGIAFNIAMDLEPFSRINPCGFSELKMTQLSNFSTKFKTSLEVGTELLNYLKKNLVYTQETWVKTYPN